MKKNIIIISVLLCIYSCSTIADRKYSIKIQNNSSVGIMAVAGLKWCGMNEYPETKLPSNKPSLISVSAHDYNYIDSSIKWEEIINSIDSDTLSIYIFNEDTIKAYDWSFIKAERKILKRYDLSTQDLKRVNWTIMYP
jgi:hypothetical protein